MRGKRNWTLAIAVLLLLCAVPGHASAQEKAPTATPTATPEFPLAAIPDGTWLVGAEVLAGLYSAPGGDRCVWKRLSGFGGTYDDTIAQGIGAARLIVEIAPTDKGFMTNRCGQWTLVAAPAAPTPSPTATRPPTNPPVSTPTAAPVPPPVVTIPSGWQPIRDERLGYSLAVPRGWHIIDLHSGQLSRMWFVDPNDTKEIEEFLASPEGENAGYVAIELNFFSMPPISSLLYVGTMPFDDDIPIEDLVRGIEESLEEEDMAPLKVQSLKTGVTNNLPSIQGIVTADLRSEGLFDVYAVITALRANDTAYILAVATKAGDARAKRQIDQIIASFRPEPGLK